MAVDTGLEDTVADGVSNSFLRLLDKSSDKLKERVDKLEPFGHVEATGEGWCFPSAVCWVINGV